MAAIEPRYRAMLLLAAWCGLRLGEVMALTVADLDLDLDLDLDWTEVG